MIQELRKDVVGRMEAWANKPSQPLEGGVRLLRTLVRQILFSFPPEKESPMAQPQEPSQQTFFDQLNEQDKQTFLMHLAQAIAKTGNVALTPEQTKFVTDVAVAITIERVLGEYAVDQLSQQGANYAKKLAEIHDDITRDVLKAFVEFEMPTSADRHREYLKEVHKVLQKDIFNPQSVVVPAKDVTPKRHPMALDIPPAKASQYIRRFFAIILSVGSIVGCLVLWVAQSPSGGINWAVPF